MQLAYGFRKLPADREFARRSAHYLTAMGYAPVEVGTALVSELNVAPAIAEEIVGKLTKNFALAC